MKLLCAVLAVSLVAMPLPARGEDIWDQAGDDQFFNMQNELAPGSSQVHDVEATGGIPDEDWFQVSQKPFSSFEVVVDGITAGMGPPVVALMSPFVALASSVGLGSTGLAQVLSFRNDSASAIDAQQLRVRSPGCGTSCTALQQ